MATTEKGMLLATKSGDDIVITYPITNTQYVDGLSEEYAPKTHHHSTVNGFTVEANVPSDAKFTDTVSTWKEFVPGNN